MRVQHDIIPPVSNRGGRIPNSVKEAAAAAAAAGIPLPTRTSGRRSIANANNARATDASVDDEMLNLAGGDSFAISRAKQLRGSTSNIPTEVEYQPPGTLADWDRHPIFPSSVKPMTDSQLGAQSFATISHRLGIDEDEHALPGGPRSTAAMRVILDLARRNWIKQMAQLQADEVNHPGASEGAFLTNSQRQDIQSKAAARSDGPHHKPIMDYDTDSDSVQSEDDESSNATHDDSSSNPLGNGRKSSKTADKAGANAATSASRTELNLVRQACLIESAKLDYLQNENARMCAELERLVEVERVERQEKDRVLEEILGTEIGHGVSAVFAPVGKESEEAR